MKLGKRSLLGRVGISRFLQLRLNAYLMWMLPLTWMQSYIRFWGKIYFFFNRDENRIIRQNIKLVIGDRKDEQSIQELIQRTFTGIFTHYAEKLFIGYSRLSRAFKFLRKNISIEGRDVLDTALAQGKGVILVTGHYGAVEFLPTFLGLQGYTLTMLLRFKTKKLKDALNHRIQSAGDVHITLVDVTQSRSVFFEAIKALKARQIVITECDEFEEWRPSKHGNNRFLGRKVPLDRTLDMLQKRSRSPVVMGIIQRKSNGRYKLGLHSLDAESEKKEVPISQKALAVLEKYILDAPHQWYQWKDASHILRTEIGEEPIPVHAPQEDRHLPLEDTPVHAC
ncbi:MAG: hypothetical protein DSY90_04445 [Deltaproteobacteria bacterium]|nr:MAG: hypothetical protein DSY90_04445 [Deltaproteobacteria bacterium]